MLGLPGAPPGSHGRPVGTSEDEQSVRLQQAILRREIGGARTT